MGLTEDQEIDRLTTKFTPTYGIWLAKNPSLEDATQLEPGDRRTTWNRPAP